MELVYVSPFSGGYCGTSRRVYASHIGYLEQQYQSKGSADDEGAVLSLTSEQEVNDAMFRLVRAGVITGKVVDDTGEPMMNVNVSVLHKPSDEEREQEGPLGKKLEMTVGFHGGYRRPGRIPNLRTEAGRILREGRGDE